MITKDISRLYEDIRVNYNKYIPFSVTWELTYRCPNNCIYCYQKEMLKNKKMELGLPQIFNTIATLADLGCNTITYSGGDPFCVDDFDQILYFTKQRGIKIIVYTSGLLLTNKLLKALIESNVSLVEITLLGGTSTTNDSLMQQPGAFDKILNNITLLLQNGIKVAIKSTILERNFSELDLLKRLAIEELGVEYLDNIKLLGQYGVGYKNIAHLKATKKQVCDYYNLYNKDKLKPLDRERLTMCEAGFSTLGITPYGDVLPCSMFCGEYVLGNLKKDCINEVWYGEKAQAFRFRFSEQFPQEKCVICSYRSFCDICPGIASWNIQDCSFGHVCEVARMKKDLWEARNKNVQN